MRTDVAALMVMEPELRDLARAVARIEVGMEKQNLRLDEIEDTLASVRGMATLAKFVTSILGIGGIALIVTAISRGSV